MAQQKSTICLDFDDCLHLSDRPWRGASIIDGVPVDGAKEAVEQLRCRFRVVVFSGRCADLSAVEAMVKWLKRHKIFVDAVCATKPLADIFVDDRAVQFKGSWPDTLDEIDRFKHWRKERPINVPQVRRMRRRNLKRR